MADPKGEGVKVGFDGSIRLEFHGAKVTALIGIENLRLAMASQRLIECLDAKARVQGVRQPPSG